MYYCCHYSIIIEKGGGVGCKLAVQFDVNIKKERQTALINYTNCMIDEGSNRIYFCAILHSWVLKFLSWGWLFFYMFPHFTLRNNLHSLIYIIFFFLSSLCLH